MSLRICFSIRRRTSNPRTQGTPSYTCIMEWNFMCKMWIFFATVPVFLCVHVSVQVKSSVIWEKCQHGIMFPVMNWLKIPFREIYVWLLMTAVNVLLWFGAAVVVSIISWLLSHPHLVLHCLVQGTERHARRMLKRSSDFVQFSVCKCLKLIFWFPVCYHSRWSYFIVKILNSVSVEKANARTLIFFKFLNLLAQLHFT